MRCHAPRIAGEPLVEHQRRLVHSAGPVGLCKQLEHVLVSLDRVHRILQKSRGNLVGQLLLVHVDERDGLLGLELDGQLAAMQVFPAGLVDELHDLVPVGVVLLHQELGQNVEACETRLLGMTLDEAVHDLDGLVDVRHFVVDSCHALDDFAVVRRYLVILPQVDEGLFVVGQAEVHHRQAPLSSPLRHVLLTPDHLVVAEHGLSVGEVLPRLARTVLPDFCVLLGEECSCHQKVHRLHGVPGLLVQPAQRRVRVRE